MSKVKAVISKVSARQVNGQQKVLIELANGDQLWVNMLYCNKLLASMFLDGARPTALVGSVVSYDKREHRAGDAVKDKDGKVVDGVAPYSKDGYNLFNFQVEEEGDKAIAYGEMHDKQAVKSKLKGAFSSVLSTTKAATNSKIEAANEVEEVEEEEAIA